MKVLVTDGENRSALAVVRSLGRRGCRVVVTAHEARSLASSSKFCAQGLAVPDPLRQGAQYASVICAIAEREAIDMIFPMTEQSIHLLNQCRDLLPARTILACPPAEKVQAITDKAALCRLAARIGVPVPQTLYLKDADDLGSQLASIDRYPVVVKPALSRIPEGQNFLPAGVKYAASREELELLYATDRALRYPSMIQEKIEGPGTGLFTLFDRDRHLALFSHRRLREKPPWGGVSVVSESIPLDEEMVADSGRLLSAVEWTGVAMVEYKRDLRDGKAKLMEINGRFWGSLQLAIACGVDFPGLLLDYLQGNRPDPVRDYLVGHRLKWIFGSLDHVYIRLKNKKENLFLPPGLPSRWQAVIEFLKIREKNVSYDSFDRKDPSPFWFEGRLYLQDLLRVGK
jgi:predicted ATP-grasp superfamily ATP-dependent carboligase